MLGIEPRISTIKQNIFVTGVGLHYRYAKKATRNVLLARTFAFNALYSQADQAIVTTILLSKVDLWAIIKTSHATALMPALPAI